MFSTWVGSCLTYKHYTILKGLARDKRYSLVQKFVTYGRKKFYKNGLWSGIVKWPGEEMKQNTKKGREKSWKLVTLETFQKIILFLQFWSTKLLIVKIFNCQYG